MSEPAESQSQSGLRNPQRAARSLAAIALVFEAFALLMAIVPMRMLLDDATLATVAIVVLVAVCLFLAAMARHSWVWPAGGAVQLALIACWAFHWSLGAAGVVFGVVWVYCWYIKRQLERPPKR